MKRLLLATLLAGCSASLGEPGEGMTHPPVPNDPRDPAEPNQPEPFTPEEREVTLDDVSATQAEAYLALIAPVMVERTLSDDERSEIAAMGGAAIPSVIASWAEEPGLPRAARRMIETALGVSGGVDPSGIDFGAPGRIVEHVVREGRPWPEILTSTQCFDASGAAAECDTGAPYAAGVITTRAFMAARQGRFNLTRAGTITRTFLCRNYPLEVELEPPLERDRLMPMFRALTAEEQTDPEAAMSGLANGFHCYACHGQFGAHAQLFVRFDVSGRWREDATGEQREGGMPGESFGGLMASHLEPPWRANETSQMVGREVANLSEAMAALTESDAFWECASQRVLEAALDLDPDRGVEAELLVDIADAARARAASPTFIDLVVAALAHPRVAYAVARQLSSSPSEAP
ncbi:hypothetical protein [Sandaracinus amylolyticus]|uniref:Cytochrome c domain-containing protein n=1 Tax=Sandaracinus amylolyticus TaxID=927083 RepID=A0A0F6W121_9BACT|nr:hypothetical protein [Sandaracinus amylolyticus]AKF04540.1 hypothetical protein DB32_001689 [Sandaracinus amylolyticus]